MRLGTLRWGLAGGVVGLLIGSFVVAIRAIDPARTVASTPTVPLVSGPGPPLNPWSDTSSKQMQVQNVLRPIVNAGQVDKALGMIRDLGDAGTGITDFRDQNLYWLVRSMVHADELLADEELDAMEAGADEKVASDMAPGNQAATIKKPPAEKPIDFAKAEEVAASIESPLIRAGALVEIGKARPGSSDAETAAIKNPDTQADYDKALEALGLMKSARSPLLDLLNWRTGVWVIGCTLIGMIGFGLLARGLNELVDRGRVGIAEEIEREVASRPKARTL